MLRQTMRYTVLIFSFFIISFLANAQTANPEKYKYIFTVAKDGSGEFTTIQAAIKAMRGYTLAPITLYLKNGVYHEKIEILTNLTDISFIGENVDSTIITFDDYSGKGNITTFTSYTAKISGNRFRAEHITFANTAGRVGQGLALYVDADMAIFKNCKFIGNQDTIFAGGEHARQYFVNCYVEGTTDFIFGPATALFQYCTIKGKSNSYITAANTPKGRSFGIIIMDSKIEADTGVTKLYLGRPWRAYANTAFIRCALPDVIVPAGWDNWGNPENEKTVRYAEYKNTGSGASNTKRVKWSKQLTKRQAAAYTVENILGTDLPYLKQQEKWFLHNDSGNFIWPVKK
jgi:pectinesterase